MPPVLVQLQNGCRQGALHGRYADSGNVSRPGSGRSSTGRLLPDDVPGCLVVSETEEPGVAELPLVGPLGEAELADERRPHPVGPLGRAAGPGERRPGDDQLVEAAPQGRQGLLVVAGPDLAGVDELAVAVVTDEQCAETGPAAGRIGEAADDELLAGRGT